MFALGACGADLEAALIELLGGPAEVVVVKIPSAVKGGPFLGRQYIQAHVVGQAEPALVAGRPCPDANNLPMLFVDAFVEYPSDGVTP